RGLDGGARVSTVAGAALSRLALAAAVATTTLFLRACRRRLVMNAEGSVSVDTAFWATAAGYFGNNFLPARAGELVRTYFVSSAARLEYPYVLATALAERVTDALALVGVALTVLLAGDVRPAWLAAAAKPVAAVAVIAAIAIALLPFFGSAVVPLVARLPVR